MKSTVALVFGILTLATAINGAANWCKAGYCKQCSYSLTSQEVKSCASCGKGVSTIAADGANAGFECKESSAIANCEHVYQETILSTLKCGMCKNGFFVSSNACVAVTTKIDNCDYYATATNCGVCSSGYVNSVDFTSCVKVSADIPNCDRQMNVLGVNVCGACKKDFKEVSGACVAEATGCSSATAPCVCRERYWAVDHMGPAVGDKCEFSSRVLGFFSVIGVALFSIINH